MSPAMYRTYSASHIKIRVTNSTGSSKSAAFAPTAPSTPTHPPLHRHPSSPCTPGGTPGTPGETPGTPDLGAQDADGMTVEGALDECQKGLVVESFRQLENNLTRSGISILMRLFQEYPNYQDLWPTLKNIPDSSLMNSEVMRNFAALFMVGLQTIIHNLDDNRKLNQQLNEMARPHHVKGVTKTHVERMLPMLLATLDDRRPELDAAWTQLFMMIAVRVEQGKHREAVKSIDATRRRMQR